MQDYRRLNVWTRAHPHAVAVRKATHSFPRCGFAELKKQITTAAESIAFNIVEGCGASSNPDFARFLQISIKSAYELEYQLLLARDYGVLIEGRWKALSKETVEIRMMLCGLRKRVLGSKDDPNQETKELDD